MFINKKGFFDVPFIMDPNTGIELFNAADIVKKHVARDLLDRHLQIQLLERMVGRAATAPWAQLASPGGGMR